MGVPKSRVDFLKKNCRMSLLLGECMALSSVYSKRYPSNDFKSHVTCRI